MGNGYHQRNSCADFLRCMYAVIILIYPFFWRRVDASSAPFSHCLLHKRLSQPTSRSSLLITTYSSFMTTQWPRKIYNDVTVKRFRVALNALHRNRCGRHVWPNITRFLHLPGLTTGGSCLLGGKEKSRKRVNQPYRHRQHCYETIICTHSRCIRHSQCFCKQ